MTINHHGGEVLHMSQLKKTAALIAALALAGAAPPATDCDPGNSGGHNNGGD
jgi:hypothetical protein